MFYLGWMFSPVQAEEITNAETQFAVGYHAFQNRDYGNGADSFFSALNSSEPLQSRARLYLAACQYYLKMNDLAAYHFNLVTRDHLKMQEELIASNLEVKLKNELKKIRVPVWIVMPYYGMGTFSGFEPNRASSTFIGLDAEYFETIYHFKLAFESLNVTAKPTSVDYSQTQWLVGFGLNFKNTSYRGRMAGVSSANLTYDGIKVYGLGASLGIFENKNRLSLDYYNSKYPGSSLGSLTVNQFTLSSSQSLFSGSDWTLAAQAGINWIMPSSTLSVDPNSVFTIKKNYLRYTGDLNFYKGSMLYSLGYGFGSEIFGVRNDAAIIYSAMEEHQSGITAAIQHHFTPHFSGRLGYARENYIIGSGAYLVNASVNSFSLLGNFLF